MKYFIFFLLLSPLFLSSESLAGWRNVEALYRGYCAECHHPERLGSIGPALLPENLRRLRKPMASQVISEGRAATQMPPFAQDLAPQEIQSLVDYIYQPLETMPTWDMEEIQSSRIIHIPDVELPKEPLHSAQLLNMFIVVEIGDHHATVLDGDLLRPIHRFQTRFALHGGPKYSPDGRFVYFGSRDGWISKFDMFSLKVVSEVRAGINMRNVAISGDGKSLIAANYLPHTLVLFNADDLTPIKVIPVTDEEGKSSSRVSAVYDASPRNSFIAALKDIREVWEIPYNSEAKILQSEEAKMAPFAIRRISSKDYLDDFFFTQDYQKLIGASRDGNLGQVVDLDQGRQVASIDIPGMPHLGSGITWTWNKKRIMATPNLKESVVSIIDMENWKVIKRLQTKGPGFFMRSHENSPYAWVDVFFGPHRDLVHVIDKNSLKIVRTLRPAPGKTSGHVEFTRDGRYALLSIWDPDGAVIVYDARSLQEVKRLPMNKPSGKYNVYNKITRSSGTSH
ncbi:MAG: c-type cytochrome [Magnetococcales bacterium]|nr:c-type cytochrome [Magnetococcales bacterium]